MSRKGPWRRRIAAALIVTMALVATLALAGDALFGRRLYFDGDRTVGASAWERAMRFAWFEEEMAGAGDDRSPALHGDHLVFSRRAGGIHDLFRRRGGGEAEPLFELSGPTHDVDPVFLHDGRTVVFASDRPGGHGGYDLYVAMREGDGFGAPRNLGPTVNTECDERHPTTPDGRTLVFLSDRLSDDGGMEPWTCPAGADTWAEPTPLVMPGLEDVTLRGLVFEPFGDGIILCASGPRGDLDLYRSRRFAGRWLSPERLDDLCTEEDEFDPELSLEGGRLVFARTAPGTSGTASRLATAVRREINEHREPPPPLWRYLLHILAPLLIALALTYLWLKWGRIHPFLKFLILSLVAHLLLMMWVDPLPSGSGVVESGGGRAHRVQWIAQPASAPSAMAARGDAVSAPSVERQSVEAQRESRVESSSPAAAAPAESGERRMAPTAAVPESEPLSAPTRSQRTSATATAAATPAASRDVSRRSGADGAPRSVTASGVSAARVETVSGAVREQSQNDRSETGAVPRPAAKGGARRALAVSAPPPGEVVVASRGARRAAVSPAAARAGEGLPSARAGAFDPAAARLEARGASAAPLAAGVSATRAERMSSPTSSPDGLSARSPTASAARRSVVQPAVPTGGIVEMPGGPRPSPTFALSRPAGDRRGRGEEVAESNSDDAPRDVATSLGRPASAMAARRRAALDAGAPTADSVSRPKGSGMTARRMRPSARRAPTADLRRPSSLLAGRRPLAPVAARDGLGRPAASTTGAPNPATPQPRALSVRRSEQPFETSGRRQIGFAVSSTSWPVPPDLAMRRQVAFDEPAAERGVPYAARRGRAKLEAIRLSGGSDETEAAVLAGLRYLSRRQRDTGGWGRTTMHEKYREVRIGKSGLALLAFLGAGATHVDDGEFREVIENGLGFLLKRQDEKSGHFGDGSSYSHGIATYAVAEAYAMTRDPGLRRPLERAVDRILRAQVRSPGRQVDGGWGYYYRDPRRTFDAWPRLSVTAWQIMALESARIGGLEVDEDVLDRAREYVAGSLDADLEAMRYSHDPAWRSNRFPTLPGSNAAAAFVLQLMGLPADDPRVRLTLDYINERPPGFRWRRASADNFVNRGHANLYFHYYAALAMHRAGGDAWARWNELLKPQLLENQAQDGSWAPVSAYAEYADDSDDDRVYTTALGVMTLEVYYRYFTPLLRHARRDENGGEKTYVEIVEVTGRRARALGLRAGDRIVLVGNVVVDSLASLEAGIETLRSGRDAPLIIRRGGRQIVRVLSGRLSGLRVGEFAEED